MPDEVYIEGLYERLSKQANLGSYEGFKTAISTDEAYRKGIYSQFGSILGTYDSFVQAIGPDNEEVKKKDGGVQDSGLGTNPGSSTQSTPQAITSVWALDESGNPNWGAESLGATAHLNTRQRSDFARSNGYVLSPDKQKELAANISQRPITDEQKEKDSLIDFIASNTPDIYEHEHKVQGADLVYQGRAKWMEKDGKWYADESIPSPEGTDLATEIREKTVKSLKEKGIPQIDDARSFVDEALANKDYKTLRDVVNSIYGYNDHKLKNQYSYTERTEDGEKKVKRSPLIDYRAVEALSFGMWDGINDQYDKEVAPLRQEKARLNMLIDAMSAQQYSITNPQIKEEYENDLSFAGKPVKSKVSPNQYSGLTYFKENNPEMYGQMRMELSKAAYPELFGLKAYDTTNRDYQYMMYQLDKKGIELNGMAINQRAQALLPEKKNIDTDYRTQISNITQAIQDATSYDQRMALQQQLQQKQEEYASNPVIQEYSKLTADAQSIDVNIQKKYPDYASLSRERMVKDILQNDLKGGNIFTKTIAELGDRFKWMLANTGEGLSNMAGLTELGIGRSRNYFRTLRRGEQQQEEMYQPAASAAIEPLYKLNFNDQDYETIKAIKYSDMADEEKSKAIADYLEANQERIRYVENPNAGKQNWSFGAIGNQLGDVGTQIIYQGALTYLTAGAGRAALGLRGAAIAGEAAATTEGIEALTAAGVDGGGAALSGAVNLGAGLNQTSLAIRSKIVNLGSIMGSTYATAYQPAYFQAIQDGKSEEEAQSYANEIALVNAISETISPDVEIVKRSLGGVGGLSQIVTESALSRAKRFGQAARAFGKGYLKNTGMETMEEIFAAYGEYGIDALHNMNQDEMNSLQQRVQQAAWATMIGMAPWGASAGFSNVRVNNKLQREAFYQAGLYADVMRGEINQLIQDGGLSQEEGNRRIQMINTMQNIINDLPAMNDGTEMNSEEKVQYAFNEAQARAYKNQAEALPEGSRRRAQLEDRQNEYYIANDKILEGSMRKPSANENTNVREEENTQTTAQSTSTPEGGEISSANETQSSENIQGSGENVQTTEATSQEQAPAPTVAYAVGSTLESPGIGEVKVISENKGIYTLEFPDGTREDFTGEEIAKDLRPVQRTPVNKEAPEVSTVEENQPTSSQQKDKGNTPVTQFVIDNVTIDDYIKANPSMTEYGREWARENEEKALKDAKIQAQNAYDYLDGKITAQEFISKGNYGSNISDEDATRYADLDTKYWADLREKNSINENISNEQPVQETSPTEGVTTVNETAPPAADQLQATEAAPIVSPVNQNENATNQIEQQGGVQQERPSGNESGQTAETGIGNSVLSEGTGQEEKGVTTTEEQATPQTSEEVATPSSEEDFNPLVYIEQEEGTPVSETGGLTDQENKDIEQMSMGDLYNGILDADPNNAVRGRINQYSKNELISIYKGAKAAQAEGSQLTPENSQAEPASRPISDVGQAVIKLNEANNLVAKRKADLEAVKDKRSAEYQARKKFYESAKNQQREAEKAYIKAMAKENAALREQKRKNVLGISPEANARADARIIANYIQMAKIYIAQGVRSLEEFASKIGETINEHMRRAWQVASDDPAPLKQEGETYKQYLKRLRAWEQKKITEAEQNNTPESASDARAQARELRLGIRKLTQGLELLKNNPDMGLKEFNSELGLDELELDTYVAVLKEMISSNDNKVTANSILKNLRQNNPKMVTATEMSLLRRQLAFMERGSKLGYQASLQEMRSVQEEVRSILKNLYDSDLLSSGTFTERDLINMGKTVSNIRNEEGLEDFSNFLQKLIDNSSVAGTLQSIKALQSRLGTLIKSNSVLTANLNRKSKVLGTSVLKALKAVNPLQIQEVLRFNAMLSNVVNSLEGKDILVESDDDIINFIDTQRQIALRERANDLKDRYINTVTLALENNTEYRVSNFLNREEFNTIVDAVMGSRELSLDGKANELKALRQAMLAFERQVEEGGNYVSIDDIYDEIKAVNNAPATSKIRNRIMPLIEAGKTFLSLALEAPDFNANEQQKEWVKSMLELNVDNMSNKELSTFKNVIDNILVNNDFSMVEAYDAKFKGQQRAKGILDFFEKTGKSISRQAFSSNVGALREALSSTDIVALAVANNDVQVAGQIYQATALGDLKAQHAQAKQLLEKTVIQPLKGIYKKYKEEGLRTYESNFKRSIYAYLAQNNYGNKDETQKEFDRRKGIVMQDIAIKSNSDEQSDREEAVALQDIFEKYFENIKSYDDLQKADILSPGERAVYNLFRTFYDTHKERFRELSESLLNRPFNDVNNYMKDSYKTLQTNITEGDLANIASSGFTPPLNMNVASNASLQRNSFNNLNNIDVTDAEGRSIGKRVINHDFDNVQIYNATSMLEDIYTLKTRMEAMEALEDRRFKEAIGSQNMKVLARNVENQVKAQMKLRKRGLNAGTAEVIAQDVAGAITKIGARMALFSVGQLIKQPADIIANTVVNLGMDAGLFIQSLLKYPPIFKGQETNANLSKLFEQSEIGLRGHTFGGTAWLNAHALSEIKNTLSRVGKNAELKDQDVLSHLIEAPDTWAAKVAWLSYYVSSLKKQGIVKSFNEVDWKQEADNINREARDYAQLMTSARLNVNSKASQSDFYARSSGGGSLTRAILLPFSSFNMNNNALLANDIATLTTNALSWKDGYRNKNLLNQKLTALRSIGSRMVAELAFQAARGALTGYVIKPLAYGLLSAIGVEPPPKKDEDFWHKVISESAMNMFFGLLGNFSIDLVAKGINKAIGDDEFIYRIKDNPNYRSNAYPGANILINPNLDNWDYMKNVLTTYTNKKGQVVATTPQEKVLLTMTAMYNIASIFGFAEGDSRRILNTAAQVVNRNKAKERGDPYWRLMNDPNSKPQIKINHKEVEWTGEQLEYYNQQRQYHLQMMKDSKWTDEYKARRATDRAKADLQKQFKGQINFKKEEK